MNDDAVHNPAGSFAAHPAPTTFVLNGSPVTVHLDPVTPLLDVLRKELGLTGTKQACDYEGECGSCTVLLDGRPVRSCLTPLGKVAGRQVLTIEGVGEPEALHPVQEAFIEVGAIQCGYCTPGMVLAAKALLDEQPAPTREQIVTALEGNLCRCTGYTKIVRAVELAVDRFRGAELPPTRPPDKAVIGGSDRRIDSQDKVTGRARYAEDIPMPDALHARVLRSPLPHARLQRLDVARASAVPGVVRVLTADDVPGRNGFDTYSRDEPVLPPVGTTVRTLGAPIALIVAESDRAAEAALEAIEVDLDPLPHTYDLGGALAPNAPLIAGDGNVLTTFELGHGDLQHAMARADFILETTYETTFLEHSALERETLLGYLDEEGRLTVAGATHEPHHEQRYIADALALPLDRVRVWIPAAGGSFGGKQDPWPFIATALMVYTTGRPVRLIYTRHDSFQASPKRHPYRVRYRVGATSDGDFTGVHLRIDCNTGGYDGHGQYISNFAVTAGGGAYRWLAVDAKARAVYTNGPKAGQFRGFGTAQSTFALECTLDELAQTLGRDPIDLRLQNAIEETDRSFLGYPVAESLGYRQVLESVRPRYDRFVAEADEYNAVHPAGPWRRGVGLAGMWYRFGKSGSLAVEAHAELAADGHVVVYCSAPDYGQGTTTVMSQMAAEALGVSRDRIEVVNADTARVPDSGIQGASRATYFVGGAVTQVVHTLKDEMLGVAAEILDLDPRSLALMEDCIVAQDAPGRSVSLAEVAAEFDRLGKARRIVGAFDLSPAFPAGSRPEYIPLIVTGGQLADVAVNLATGDVRVRRIVAAHDVGRAVNRLDAEGQVEGAVIMGLGAALMEEFLPGRSTGFSDYYLPTVRSMPEIEVILVEVPGRHGPHGVKGLGEAAMLPSTPAIINAISRAIGARIRTIPATPERVLAAIGKPDR